MDMLCQLSYKGVQRPGTLAPDMVPCQADRKIDRAEARDLLTLFTPGKTPYQRRTYLIMDEGEQADSDRGEEHGLDDQGDA
jgi:hypothetical protein